MALQLTLTLVCWLLTASPPELVVKEYTLPEVCVFDLYGDSSDEFDACIDTLQQELPALTNGVCLPLGPCGDKHVREIAAGGLPYYLELIHIDPERRGEPAFTQYVVYSKHETVYDYREMSAPSDVWAFFGHGDQWILETRTRVIVSGVDVAAANNLDEAAVYRIIGGQAVFLARKGSKYNVMTEHGALSVGYDRIYYHLCCEWSLLNPGCTADKLSFLALRGDEALYVEVVPNSSEP